MARRIVSNVSLTPTGTADATNLVDATYPFLLQGGSATQRNLLWELSLVGLGSSGAVTPMLLSRDSTVAATNSSGAGEMDVSVQTATAALGAPPLTGNTNTTKPQRSSTLHLSNAGFNAFGGNYFWRANRPDECFDIVGNTASLGEVSVSCYTGGSPGPIGGHMIYEPL